MPDEFAAEPLLPTPKQKLKQLTGELERKKSQIDVRANLEYLRRKRWTTSEPKYGPTSAPSLQDHIRVVPGLPDQ